MPLYKNLVDVVLPNVGKFLFAGNDEVISPWTKDLQQAKSKILQYKGGNISKQNSKPPNIELRVTVHGRIFILVKLIA